MIDETDMDIEVDNFIPNKSKVTLEIAAAEDESADWLPRSTKNRDWKKKEKCFKMVLRTFSYLLLENITYTITITLFIYYDVQNIAISSAVQRLPKRGVLISVYLHKLYPDDVLLFLFYCLQTRMLPGVMHLDGCHLCKSPYPRDAMTVDAKTNSVRFNFHGKFAITLQAAVSKTEGAQTRKKKTRKEILFRMPPVPVSVHYGKIKIVSLC